VRSLQEQLKAADEQIAAGSKRLAACEARATRLLPEDQEAALRQHAGALKVQLADVQKRAQAEAETLKEDNERLKREVRKLEASLLAGTGSAQELVRQLESLVDEYGVEVMVGSVDDGDGNIFYECMECWG
jgi:alanyl-tRNA synthetase